MATFKPLDDVFPGRALPLARIDREGRPTQLYCQVPDLASLQELERSTGRVALTYVPVLGWAEHALARWEREQGTVVATPWRSCSGGLAVPTPVYRLDEEGLAIVDEAGSVKAVLDLGQHVTHMPGIFLSEPAGFDAEGLDEAC
ncbi:hypothetical protein [Hydrogenophaga sp. RWCD_12]|uniref:hypothetical protein n=1 Tax=Hydrogenophaga sp. RWCD_12 TaxID=3391190 RepID=UPI0039847947